MFFIAHTLSPTPNNRRQLEFNFIRFVGVILFLVLPCLSVAYNNDPKWRKIDSTITVLEKNKLESLDLAEAYYKAGQYISRFGSVSVGHEYYYKAIRIYESHPGKQNEIAIVYYMIASDFLQTLDEVGLQKTVQKLEELAAESPIPPVLYHVSSIKGVYYYSLLRNQSPLPGIRDSSLKYFKKSIELVEKYRDSSTMHLVVAWNYYNVAYLYNHYFSPSKVDSTERYWERMKKAKKEFEIFSHKNAMEASSSLKNMEFSILYLKAWIQYHKKE